jgi:hypothetical protein
VLHPPDSRRTRLPLTVLGFSLLAGCVSFLYMFLTIVDPVRPDSMGLDLPFNVHLSPLLVAGLVTFGRFSLPVMFSSAFSWWLCIVLPRRVRAWAGAGAGLLSVLFALPPIWVILVVTWPTRGSGSGSFLASFLGFLALVIVVSLILLFFTPFGWGILLIAGVAGAGFALCVRRHSYPAAIVYLIDPFLRPPPLP